MAVTEYVIILQSKNERFLLVKVLQELFTFVFIF